MNAPHDIPRQLAAVRRAWRRSAVLAGCAVAGVEAIGVLVLFLIIDALFIGSAAAHTVLGTLTWAAVAGLFAWHAGRPLVRRITDQEVALYIEERTSGFHGALLTATESASGALSPAQAEMVALATLQAGNEAAANNPVQAVRLVTLRKYVIACGCLLLGWVMVLVAAPASVSRRVIGALNPLRDPTIPLGTL